MDRLPNKRILIVEDEPEPRTQLTHLFEDAGRRHGFDVEIHAAATLLDAYDKLEAAHKQNRPFDLILADTIVNTHPGRGCCTCSMEAPVKIAAKLQDFGHRDTLLIVTGGFMEPPSNVARITGRIEKRPSAETAGQFFTDPAAFAADAAEKLAQTQHLNQQPQSNSLSHSIL